MAYTGILRAVLKGRLGGIVATRNMFTGQIQLGVGETEREVLEQYITDVFTPLLAYISTGWTTESLEIQHWVDTEWISMSDETFVIAGTVTASQMLANLVAVVLIAKGVGKRLIGRKFIAGITEAAVAGNALEPTVLAAAAQSAAVYFDVYTTASNSVYGPGIMDKNNQFHAFASGIVSALLGTMRRRKPGLGI